MTASVNGWETIHLHHPMALLVKEAIWKYINPTRYRQIIETESSTRLVLIEQEIILEDQKYSSDVTKSFYSNKMSRDIATKGKRGDLMYISKC